MILLEASNDRIQFSSDQHEQAKRRLSDAVNKGVEGIYNYIINPISDYINIPKVEESTRNPLTVTMHQVGKHTNMLDSLTTEVAALSAAFHTYSQNTSGFISDLSNSLSQAISNGKQAELRLMDAISKCATKEELSDVLQKANSWAVDIDTRFRNQLNSLANVSEQQFQSIRDQLKNDISPAIRSALTQIQSLGNEVQNDRQKYNAALADIKQKQKESEQFLQAQINANTLQLGHQDAEIKAMRSDIKDERYKNEFYNGTDDERFITAQKDRAASGWAKHKSTLKAYQDAFMNGKFTDETIAGLKADPRTADLGAEMEEFARNKYDSFMKSTAKNTYPAVLNSSASRSFDTESKLNLIRNILKVHNFDPKVVKEVQESPLYKSLDSASQDDLNMLQRTNANTRIGLDRIQKNPNAIESIKNEEWFQKLPTVNKNMIINTANEKLANNRDKAKLNASFNSYRFRKQMVDRRNAAEDARRERENYSSFLNRTYGSDTDEAYKALTNTQKETYNTNVDAGSGHLRRNGEGKATATWEDFQKAFGKGNATKYAWNAFQNATGGYGVPIASVGTVLAGLGIYWAVKKWNEYKKRKQQEQQTA